MYSAFLPRHKLEISFCVQAPSTRPRAALFLVDRSMDPTAPFLHEFWYQAMVNDLLVVEDGNRYQSVYCKHTSTPARADTAQDIRTKTLLAVKNKKLPNSMISTLFGCPCDICI